eukprot:3343159-Pyramimonas_sp.AAC.1
MSLGRLGGTSAAIFGLCLGCLWSLLGRLRAPEGTPVLPVAWEADRVRAQETGVSANQGQSERRILQDPA